MVFIWFLVGVPQGNERRLRGEEASILIVGRDSFWWSMDLGSEQVERKGRD